MIYRCITWVFLLDIVLVNLVVNCVVRGGHSDVDGKKLTPIDVVLFSFSPLFGWPNAQLTAFSFSSLRVLQIRTQMDVPDVSMLTIHDPGPANGQALCGSDANANMHIPHIPEDITQANDRYMIKLKNYAKSIPYSIESNVKIQALLDFILLRITQCAEAKDYDPGLLQWDSMLS